jgi:hypothetical protein
MKWIFEVKASSIDCIHRSRARRWKSSPLTKRDHAPNQKESTIAFSENPQLRILFFKTRRRRGTFIAQEQIKRE